MVECSFRSINTKFFFSSFPPCLSKVEKIQCFPRELARAVKLENGDILSQHSCSSHRWVLSISFVVVTIDPSMSSILPYIDVSHTKLIHYSSSRMAKALSTTTFFDQIVVKLWSFRPFGYDFVRFKFPLEQNFPLKSVGSKYATGVFFPRMSDGLLRWPVSWLSHIFETAFPEKKIGINCVVLLLLPHSCYATTTTENGLF